jgi:hypothetical protein
MKSVLLTSIAVLMLGVMPASAKPPSGVVEDSRELEPRMIALPSSLVGTVSISCAECTRESYTMKSDVRFYAAKQEVSFADFKLYIGTHPDSAVLLVTLPNQKIITRFHAQ